MSQYTSVTLTSAISQLSARLNDSANIYFTGSELQNAIVESLRMFQCLTGFYRERVPFQTVANQVFYDLRLVAPNQYAFTITDNQLLSEIQSHLLEPITNPWTGTNQFSISVISSALKRSRDQFLTDTGIYCTRTTLSGMPDNGRMQLPKTLLDIRRSAWMDSSTLLTYALVRTDEYASLGYSRSWPQQPQLPYSYSVAVTPPVSLQLIPAPVNSGTLDLCILSSGPDLICSTSSPVVLGIPDDYCWGVKYLALADLFSEDGPSADPDRAQYCRILYNMSVGMGLKPVTVLLGRIQEIETPISSIEDFDRYRTNWQNIAATTPVDILQVSPNLIALAPRPDDTYTITLDMVRSMPIPSAGGDYLQISMDLLEPILDMSQHIACLKMGGPEFMATTPLRDNFLKLSGLNNARLKANIFYNMLLSQPSMRQDTQIPRLVNVQ